MAATKTKQRNASRLVDGSGDDTVGPLDPHSSESLLCPGSVKLEPLDFQINDLSPNESSVVNNAHDLQFDLWDLKSEIKTETSGEEHLTFEDAEMIMDPFKDCDSSEVKPEKGQLNKHVVSESLQQAQADDHDERPLVQTEQEDSNHEGLFCQVLKYRDRSEQPHSPRTSKCGKRKTRKTGTKKTSENRQQEHLCTLCGNMYANARNLDIHMRIHTGERPYVCQTCGKAFTRSDRLASHTMIHTGQRKPAKPHKFACSQCERTFALPCYLRNHMRRHTQERLYACHMCEKRFFASGDRDKHVRIHLHLRPFVCTECGSGFERRSSLNKHLRIHTGERPYNCPECGKALRYKYSLTMHMKIHRK